MKKIIICFLILLSLSVVLVPSKVASADTGPKPSVRVQFENMTDTLCYGTLLSKSPSTGPYSVWNGNEENIYNYSLDIEIWRAFVSYVDDNGYYFLQTAWKVSETKEIAWTYYPPQNFKILLYYPQTNKFVVSDIYEKYAFDTYYTVNMKGLDFGAVDYNEDLSTDERLHAYPSYNFGLEITLLILRIIVTILIEIIIAFLFGFRKKEQVLLIVIVNSVTQVILNLLLNFASRYLGGALAVSLYYVIAEIVVFLIESFVYCKFINKWTALPKSKGIIILYCLVANLVSFGIGLTGLIKFIL